jgi:multidrug efflux pump
MTSLAFIGGMIPLFIASGAGAASRIAVGSGVIGGMLAATLMGIFFTPLFYLSVRHWLNRDRPVHAGPAREGPATDDGAGGAHEQ